MKKRIVALILAVVMLFTCAMLGGCGEKAKAPEAEKDSVAVIVNNALKKNEQLDAISAVMKMEMSMKMEGMTMDIPLTAKIKAKNLNKDGMVASVDMTMSMMGQEIAMQMYQEGEWAYMVMEDIKYKVSAKDMEGEMDYANSAKDMLKEIPEELLKDVKIVEGKDGSKTVTINFPADKFTELYTDVINDVNSNSGTETDEFKISDAVVTVTMVGDYVTVFDMSFKMDMTIEGVKATTTAKVSLTYDDPGKEVVITPPEGYQNFEEMDMGGESMF